MNMRRIKVIGLWATIFTITASMLMAKSSNPSSEQQVFLGDWINVDANGTPLKLKINIDGDTWKIQGWGKCHPADCDWGTVPFSLVGSSVEDKSFNYGFAHWNPGFKDRYMVLRHDGKQLIAETISIFKDKSNRSNTRLLSILKRSSSPLTTSAIDHYATKDEDCVSYDPTTLEIVDEGYRGWLLTDGRSRIALLDNKNDAEKALSVARRYTAHCFIGRKNMKSNRKNYIVEYWTGDSGLKTIINGREDCIPYNQAKLHIVDDGSRGWLLTDGRSRMLVLSNKKDAEKAFALAKRHRMQCFIGRSNKRSNRKDYIFRYWK
jgi:hypothetical protein